MTRNDCRFATACLAVALLAGYNQAEPAKEREANAPVAAASSGATPETLAQSAPLSAMIDPEPEPATQSEVISQEDISVNGEPGCALRVRYAGTIDQPVTWRGEPCTALTIRFVGIEELRKIGQADKLGEEAADDMAQLPGGKALYIEGEFAAAIYPQDTTQHVYKVPLAD